LLLLAGARLILHAGVIHGANAADGVSQGVESTTPVRPDILPMMKRLIPAVAIILGWASAAWAAAPGTLTTLRAVHALTNAEASRVLPVAFEATVVYSRGYENLLFVQDGDIAVFVRPPTAANLVPGDRVLVRGTTQGSFRPIVVADSVALLYHGAVPRPVPANFDELIRAQLDSRLVTVHAVVHAADLVLSSTAPVLSTRLQMLTEGGHIEVNLDSDNASAINALLDAEVEVTGIAAGKFDDKMQQTGVVLYVSTLANIRVLTRANASPWSLPVTPMDQVLAVYHMRDLTPRVRVQGTITYYQPGSAIVLQDGPKSLWIATHTREPLQIGDRADATGFPDAHDRLLTLTDGEIQDSHIQAPIAPQPATWRQLAFWSNNKPDGHLYDLVSIEGQVVTEVREASQDEYVLVSDGQLFTAIFRHPHATAVLPSMMRIPLGSRIRVTGICMIVDANAISPGEEAPFNILLRSFDDVTVVAEPSWLNTRNLIRIASVLLLAVISVAVWGGTLKRKVRRQTAALSVRIEAEAARERQMAQLEQRRSRILEDINGTAPLSEIVEQITQLSSFRLNGAPCWCEVTDGAKLGAYPPKAKNLRVIHEEIPARSGPALGKLFAAFDPGTPPGGLEYEALRVGARLATLAIETRRLYSDLLRRSEFDLLTDIHNRFSLEKHLNAQIEEAREKAGIFGLIYIDLDEFKQVNDLYGHHVGDLYLQEVALRMKRQLRSHDMLARLGGDEFAVLVPVVRNRAHVEEIAQRLERSFDEPLAIEGYVLQGSASFGIALYPEDGATKDNLLSAADSAMYAAKSTKKQIGQMLTERQALQLTPEN
jgi:diguanylate cyclase (GGDEF)-like protein